MVLLDLCILEDLKEVFEQNEAFRRIFTGVAKETGLRLDESSNSLSGKLGGYNVSVVHGKMNNIVIQLSVRYYGHFPSADTLKAAAATAKGIVGTAIIGNKASFMLGSGTDALLIKRTVEALNNITAYFRESGYNDVCEHCGIVVDETSYYRHDGEVNHFCRNCFGDAANILNSRFAQIENVKENVLLGLVGALIGSIVGAGIIILLGWIGVFASFAGFVLAFGTLMGYKSFGKKLSIKGIVICVVIMIVMTLLANHVVWTVDIYRELVKQYDNVSMMSVFKNLIYIVSDLDLTTEFSRSIFLLFLFTILGAHPTIKRSFIERKAAAKALKDRAA